MVGIPIIFSVSLFLFDYPHEKRFHLFCQWIRAAGVGCLSFIFALECQKLYDRSIYVEQMVFEILLVFISL